MINITLYIEDEIKDLEEFLKVNEQCDKLTEHILNIKVKKKYETKLLDELYLKISQLYYKMAIFEYKHNDKDNAYHFTVMGYAYYLLIKNIDSSSNKYSDFIYTKLHYIFAYNFIERSNQPYLYDIATPGEVQSVDMSPPNLEDFIQTIDILYQYFLINFTSAAYISLICFIGYKDKLSDLERFTLLAGVKQKINDQHSFYNDLEDRYTKYLVSLKYFPIAQSGNIRFIKKSWAIEFLLKLCDDWFIKKAKNPGLFFPSRLIDKADENLLKSDFKKITFSYETVIIQPNQVVQYEIYLSPLQFLQYVSQLRPIGVSVGSPINSNTHIIDLALKERGFLDDRFVIQENEFDRLNDPVEKEKLFQKIKDLAPKYGFILREDDLKRSICDLYEETCHRLNCLKYSRNLYFVGHPFLSAFFLLYKGLNHDNHLFPKDNNFSGFIEFLNKTRKFVSNSFAIHLEHQQIFKNTTSFPEDKLKELKTYCEKMMAYVFDKKEKILLQIQVVGSKESHAIYGVLEPILQGVKVTGIQLIISNGGDGVHHHKRFKKKTPPLPQFYDFNENRKSHLQWMTYEGKKPLCDYTHYKGVKITNLEENSLKAFCYYLMLCSSGEYLILTQKACTSAEYIDAIYSPAVSLIKHSNWVSHNIDLNILKVFDHSDQNQAMPEQVIGNCAIHNALYAIQYAEKLSPMEMWYLNYMLETGVDEHYSSTFLKKADLTSSFQKNTTTDIS